MQGILSLTLVSQWLPLPIAVFGSRWWLPLHIMEDVSDWLADKISYKADLLSYSQRMSQARPTSTQLSDFRNHPTITCTYYN
ncbi:hypothetical protein B0T20DRAFT_203002 [Sordaria brevicollis]|uniref:Uncharacterized protein n=1 Tax=Sordaria brevicollis TaxID=83679 RepID=A0AAE0PE71_SORBR|nr:hypothetical protein B0T20DRAFT_203002 [Sordaria brevicollis]